MGAFVHEEVGVVGLGEGFGSDGQAFAIIGELHSPEGKVLELQSEGKGKVVALIGVDIDEVARSADHQVPPISCEGHGEYFTEGSGWTLDFLLLFILSILKFINVHIALIVAQNQVGVIGRNLH